MTINDRLYVCDLLCVRVRGRSTNASINDSNVSGFNVIVVQCVGKKCKACCSSNGRQVGSHAARTHFTYLASLHGKSENHSL